MNGIRINRLDDDIKSQSNRLTDTLLQLDKKKRLSDFVLDETFTF